MCAGKADERGIRQGIAQVAGEAVGNLAGLLIHLAAEPILAAVRFIRDHDDVLPRAQLGQRLALFRYEFVNGREHHAAACPVQQLAQMLAPAGLHRRLAADNLEWSCAGFNSFKTFRPMHEVREPKNLPARQWAHGRGEPDKDFPQTH